LSAQGLGALELSFGVKGSAMFGYADERALSEGVGAVTVGLSSFGGNRGTEGPSRKHRLSWSAELEAGLSPLGIQILLEGGPRWMIGSGSRLSLALGPDLIAGAALFKPIPLAILGLGVQGEARWYLTKTLALSLSLRPRYSACLGYIIPYEVWELPLGLALVKGF